MQTKEKNVNPFIISSVEGLPLLFSDFYLAVLLLAISFDDGTLAFNKVKKIRVMILSGQGYIGNDAAANRIQEATDSKIQVANSYEMYKLGSTKGS